MGKDVKVVKISGKDYDSAVFMVCGKEIFTFAPELGFMRRDGWDIKRLNAHIADMKLEGLNVEMI